MKQERLLQEIVGQVSFTGQWCRTEQQLADAAQLSSLADETAEGRSIVILAKEKFALRERILKNLK